MNFALGMVRLLLVKDPKRMLDPEAGTDPVLRDGLDAFFRDLPSEQVLGRVQAEVTASVKHNGSAGESELGRTALCGDDGAAETTHSGIKKRPVPPAATTNSFRFKVLLAICLALMTTLLSLFVARQLGYL